MKRLFVSYIASATLLTAGFATAQTPSDSAPVRVQQPSVLSGMTVEEIQQIAFEDVPAPELPPMETSAFAARTLDYESGVELLKSNNIGIEIARKSLEDAAIIDSQTRQIFAPNINLGAQLIYNSHEITLGANEMGLTSLIEPFGPYLMAAKMDHPELPDPQTIFENMSSSDEDTVVQPHTDYSGSLTVTQPLFTAQIFPAKKLAEIVKKQAYAGVEVAVQQSLVAYNELYFQAVNLRQFISVAEQNVDNAKMLLDQAQALFEEQAGPEFDVTRAEVQYRSAKRDLANASSSYEIAIRALATLMRTQPDFDVVVPDNIDAPKSVQEVLDVAMDERPEFLANELEIERNDKLAKTSKMTYLPVIMAQGKASAARKTIFTGQVFNWSVGLIASWDLFDGGAALRDKRSAQIEQSRAELRLEQEKDQIRNEIHQAWLEMKNQEGVIEQAEAEFEFAQKNFTLTQDARRLGAASSLDVDVAKNQLYQAQLAYANAKHSRLSAIYNLYILQGTSPSILRATK